MRSAFSTKPNVAGCIVGMNGGGGTPGGELIAFAVLAASFLLFSSIAALMDSMGPARGVKTTPREEEDAVREDARRAAVKVRVVGVVVVVSGVRRTCIVKLERGKVTPVTSSSMPSPESAGFTIIVFSCIVYMFNAM